MCSGLAIMHSFIVYKVAPRGGRLPASGAVAVMKGLPATPWTLQLARESSSLLNLIISLHCFADGKTPGFKVDGFYFH